MTKLILFLFLGLSFNFTARAMADTLVSIVAGQKYRCELVPKSPLGSARCIEWANHTAPFDLEESRELCFGSNDESPADCAIEALNGSLSKNESIHLCRSALTMGPWLCFDKLITNSFVRKQALQICGNPRVTLSTAKCVLKLNEELKNKERALTLCRMLID